jgi:hypothetical protein
LFFATFLALYYVVLVQRSYSHITIAEVFLYIWIAGFAYDEFGEIQDAGQTSFYTTDFWFVWDLGIVAFGLAFLILSELRLDRYSDCCMRLTDLVRNCGIVHTVGGSD